MFNLQTVARASLALNILQLILLFYWFYRERSYLDRKAISAEILGLDRALHQRVDSMEDTWEFKWKSLSDKIGAMAVKAKRFFEI